MLCYIILYYIIVYYSNLEENTLWDSNSYYCTHDIQAYVHKSVKSVTELHTASICDYVKKNISGPHGNLNSPH